MAKVELGVKRTCLSCGMRFYDFKRNPIICPGCGIEFDLQNLVKGKKSREVRKVKRKEVLSDNEVDLEGAPISDGDGHKKPGVDCAEEIDFDEEDVEDTDEDRIIRDDLSDNDPLLPNLDKKEE